MTSPADTPEDEMTDFASRKPFIGTNDRRPWQVTARTEGPSLVEQSRRGLPGRWGRRSEVIGGRALDRLDRLGPAWHVVAWPRADAVERPGPATKHQQDGILAVGPGGVFAISVVEHGRSRVLVAGDVVQINGRRPDHVVRARRDATRARRALSAAVGLAVPVVPVLTFVGSGKLSFYGLPEDCLVTTYRELDRLLIAGGARISPDTAAKLSAVAADPHTWLNAPYRRAAGYRWYGDGQTATDKRAAAG